jgi:hypothetical protein
MPTSLVKLHFASGKISSPILVSGYTTSGWMAYKKVFPACWNPEAVLVLAANSGNAKKQREEADIRSTLEQLPGTK